MPTFTNDLKAVATSLDEKIAALTSTKDAIEAVKTLPGNEEKLVEVTAKLNSLQSARLSLEASCCGQSCEIIWNS